MTEMGHTRSSSDVGSMSGLPESGHDDWAIYEYTPLGCGIDSETARIPQLVNQLVASAAELMARHSAAEQAAASIAIASPELPPPAELTPEEAAIWREIVGSMPASWFDSGNAPVLIELCRHIVLSRWLAGELAALDKTRLTATTARAQKQRAIYQQLLQAVREESRLITVLSTKLRLTNSSHRRDERYDDRRRLALPSARVPWERQ
jgi:hypothetical protein